MHRLTTSLSLLACLLAQTMFAGSSRAQGTDAAATPTAQDVIATAAQSQQFTYILFYKQNDPATQAMDRTLQTLIAPHAARAVGVGIQLANPADADIVNRYNVSRAPMPLLMAIAPNGAVTGFFQTPPTAAQFEKALVTPTMTVAMKSMQEGKLVLVCASSSRTAQIPAGAQDLLADPAFQARTVMVRLTLADPAEERFIRELQLNPNDPLPQMAILAPPGMLVGKFAAGATKADLASKLHAAGKCCDDPNCKHGQK